MKKFISIIVVLFTIVIGYSQERVNAPIYKFNNSSDILKNIMGWCFNDISGQWCDNKNFIYPSKLYSEPESEISHNNVNHIQLKSFEYNNKIHYVMIIYFKSGHYKYPHIKRDWIDYNKYNVYYFTEDEYNIITQPNEYNCLELSYISHYQKYEDNELINIILKDINYKYSVKGIFVITRYKDVIRFNYGRIWSDDKRHMKYEYFEVPIVEWNKLKIK